ncbi:MAG TPA: BTAD domain-containing putative transcriptional regulator [Gemmatimonadaceae bacterium]|nr:BTAD domain-containing putative transcriptional regulator [Gemmatimonadaceae bacterium]
MNDKPRWYLRLLGTPSLESADGARLSGGAAQRHRLGLLALLVLAPDQRLTRDKAIAYLWPEKDPDRARQLLNAGIYTLRKALGESALTSVGDDVCLDTQVVRSDVMDFAAAIQRGDHAAASALYRGELLDGFFISDAPEFERWAERERARLIAGYDSALEALAEAAESSNDFRGAAGWWRTRAARDPYDSRVALRLMQALEANGNPAAALQHAALHERLLQAELGVGSAPAIAALVERLRGQRRSTEAAARPATGVPAETGRATHAGATAARGPSATEGTNAVERASEAEGMLSAEQSLAMEESSTTHGSAAPVVVVHAPPAMLARRARWLGTAVILAVALVGAAWIFWPGAAAPESSIVVLPFLDLSADANHEYFSDGLTEEVITRLSAIPDLKVISRTSAMHYKGSRQSLREIARELNVTHVLEGSVRWSDSTVRISAQLIDARTDAHVWADSYEDELQAAFRVQEDIARDVARTLELELGDQVRRRIGRRGTRDAEAYEFYRRGRFFWALRTPDAHEQAIAYFERAIERDSSYADAYAGLADAYLTAWQLATSTRTEEEAYSRFRWAAERAVSLDDESADAHTSYAVALWWKQDWPGAERELRRAIELNPGHATARSWYSLLLRGMGRPAEARDEARRAHEVDPFAVVVSSIHAWNCYLDHDDDCAIERLGRVTHIGTYAGAWEGLAVSYGRKEMFDSAMYAVRTAMQLAPERHDFVADLAFVQALAGDEQAARESLRRAELQPREPFNIARAYVALGESDSAFAWLERASWKWPHRAVLSDPALDPIRADPRFARLSERVAREMGLR